MLGSRYVDNAIAEVRAVADPYQRLQMAEGLDEALTAARSAVARIRQDTIRSLRDPATGYGTIAQRLSLTKSRIQQIANTPARQIVAAYAFRDELGAWHGEPRLLARGRYQESPTSSPFDAADKYHPLAGQVLTVRYGEIAEYEAVSVYTLQVRLADGQPLNLRMTHRVQAGLFGPPMIGSSERAVREDAREQKRRELDGA